MGNPPIWQRLVALLAYLLPWSDGVGFGRYLFNLVPALQWSTLPALPILMVERAIPFGGFLLFLVLFLVVVRNPRIPYFIRFNVLQAILIDIVLVLLGLVFQVVLVPLQADFATRTLSNTIFLGTVVVVLFAAIECARGREADIPTLSSAVRMQLF
ncbi:hypothetical protein EVJ50_10565 [Synechococcus sp. RSCCF101]|uniref:Tic20 family protein n=1 Tax=Synechococcus sp. RSCCF101 TaxID=2511069 RepID=UPI00124591A3|nr:Tic20 family protein [Synechococcus sp. RSCCF101]QEY32597.1 hypothetical protein EVJ50_10565 [Synechococcus sp. RSCCF101]